MRLRVRISIHAPLTGSDHADDIFPGRKHRFQSTLPLRGATRVTKMPNITPRFQSTLPLRGATAKISFAVKPYFISIHAPLTGSDKVLFL